MATVSTTLRLIDGVSGPLSSMTRAINNVIGSFNSLSGSSINFSDGLSVAAENASEITSAINETNVGLSSVNQSISSLTDGYRSAENGQRSLNEQINHGVSAGDKLWRAIKGIAGTYLTFQGVKGLISWSDEMTNINARIGIIKGSLDSVEGIQDKIMASANRTYSSYMNTANAVTQFGMAAGEAFSGTDEIIAFTELLNKQFTISGVKAEQQASVLFNMTQALSAGVLRGQDLNTIMQNMAPYAQMIADELGVTKAEMRELAAQGKITADVMKAALLKNADKINQQYEAMPYTFADMWNLAKNSIIAGFRDFQGALEKTVNSKNLKSSIEAIGKAVKVFGSVATVVFSSIINVVGVAYRILSKISPLVWTVVGGFLAYKSVMAAIIVAQKVWAGVVAIWGSLKTVINVARVALLSFKNAQLATTAATLAFNAAWLGCPATWVLLGIVGAIGVVVAAVWHFSDSFGDAMGKIVGGVLAVGAAIGNIFIGAFDGILQIADNFLNVFIGAWEWFLNIFSGGFDGVCGSIQNAFGQLIAGMMSALKPFVWVWDKVFGTKGMDAINNWQDVARSWGKNDNAVKLERDIITNRFAKDRISMSGAYDFGYNKVAGINDSIQQSVSMADSVSGAGNNAMMMEMNDLLSDISKNTSDTLGAINGVNDTLEIEDSDAELLRALAERETINRFTTAEVKLDFTANNNISNPFDVGSVISELERQLTRSIKSAMEGAY